MRWVLFLFLFGLGFPASVVYEAKLQMSKVSDDDVIRYLNYLYTLGGKSRKAVNLLRKKSWQGGSL